MHTFQMAFKRVSAEWLNQQDEKLFKPTQLLFQDCSANLHFDSTLKVDAQRT